MKLSQDRWRKAQTIVSQAQLMCAMCSILCLSCFLNLVCIWRDFRSSTRYRCYMSYVRYKRMNAPSNLVFSCLFLLRSPLDHRSIDAASAFLKRVIVSPITHEVVAPIGSTVYDTEWDGIFSWEKFFLSGIRAHSTGREVKLFVRLIEIRIEDDGNNRSNMFGFEVWIYISKW